MTIKTENEAKNQNIHNNFNWEPLEASSDATLAPMDIPKPRKLTLLHTLLSLLF